MTKALEPKENLIRRAAKADGMKIITLSPEQLNGYEVDVEHNKPFLFLINDHSENFRYVSGYPVSTLTGRLLSLQTSEFEMDEAQQIAVYEKCYDILFKLFSRVYNELITAFPAEGDATVTYRIEPIYQYTGKRFAGALSSFTIESYVVAC